MSKAKPTPAPRTITVRDSLPPGAAIRLTPNAVQTFVRLFGAEALARAGQGKSGAGEG